MSIAFIYGLFRYRSKAQMNDSLRIATQQLSRMRGMNRFYHERFFADVRFTTIAVIALFVAGAWVGPIAFLLIPPIALLGAVQTAFDASYLIFARHYSATLERKINEATKSRVLVAHEIEDSYLFPLDETKIVTATMGSGFSWFGFVTLFYTALGILAFGFGLTLGWDLLLDSGAAWTAAYLGSLGLLSMAGLITGLWWFVGGTGEQRLKTALENVTLGT